MEPTLFGAQMPSAKASREPDANAPLAARMRPRTIEEYVGQTDIVAPGRALRRAIESDHVPSMILWGPPGTGKTTLAEIIARTTGAHFTQLSAVSAGVADLRKVVAEAQTRKKIGQRSVLFIDEIHRFNKAQQDAVLPYVEDGTVTLIGATTENPSFEVNSALLSRARVFVLKQLDDEEIATIVDRALNDEKRGVASLHVKLDPDARETLIGYANGDARTALNALEFASETAPERDGVRQINKELIKEALQKRGSTYDKGGEQHYDVISAFIKSIRASDPDAAVYWLARMIDGGEDALFIARRLVILASEDVGLADSQGIQVAIAAQQAVHFVGMPEGFFPLAHATLYLAKARKSNSVGRAYGAAMRDVQETRNDPVPLNDMQRRDALHLLGGAFAFSLAGCGWDQHDAAPVPQGCGTPSTSTSFGAVIYGSDDLDLAMQLLVGCGSRYVRVGVDTTSFQRTDAVLAKAQKYGLRAVLISQYSPQPVNRAAYAQECGAIHRRYEQYDPIWEIWNEPNLASYWGAAPNVTNYASLAKAAGTALRNNGATQIWSGGTSGIDVRWTYALLQEGVFDVLNGCAVHSYKPAPAAFAEYVALQKLLPAGMPIHTTETCVASNQDDQSEFLREMWYIHRRLSLPTLIWCELRDFTAGDHAPYNYPYGILWSTYRPKDVYYVAKSLASSCE